MKRAFDWLKFRVIGRRYNAYAVGVSNFGGSRQVFFMDYDALDWERVLPVFNGLSMDIHVLSTKHGCLFVSTALLSGERYMRILEVVLRRLMKLGVKHMDYRFGNPWIRVSPKYSTKQSGVTFSSAPLYVRWSHKCDGEDISLAHLGVLCSLGMPGGVFDEHLARNHGYATILEQKIYRTRD